MLPPWLAMLKNRKQDEELHNKKEEEEDDSMLRIYGTAKKNCIQLMTIRLRNLSTKLLRKIVQITVDLEK